MPIISFVSPKGGVGKTTSALILATELASSIEQNVTIVDADPNLPLSRWAKHGNAPNNLDVVSDKGESTIVDAIAAASERSAFVIVDLEGVASARVTNAIQMSNLAIIPVQASLLDAEQAARAISLIHNTARAMGRPVPYRVLFNRVPASQRIRSRNFKSIAAELDEQSIPAFKTQLAEREAYKSLFTHGGTLDTLDSAAVASLVTAKQNAQDFAEEVIGVLRAAKQGRGV
ncbi:ParA family protein [Sphingomonas sp. CARO-RG-8B-R24-01]|uniref:AAA family ATPase n=1 Tax=Sphingomonas sp. CARO-RG-8B-R24-01 TaxID=2914831 RepID=UPI001F5A9C57